jgi:hypothetical protein
MIDYLEFYHGLAFLELSPAFKVINATPESIIDTPYSSDLVPDL